MAKQTFMARVKAYRKLHPRTSQVDAMKKLAGKKPAAKKKTVVGSPKKAKKKPYILSNLVQNNSASASSSRRADKGQAVHTANFMKAMRIVRDIAKKEQKLRVLKDKDAIIALKHYINAQHDELDRINKMYSR